MFKLIVIGDGVITDPERDGEEFRSVYLADLARLLGESVRHIERDANRFEECIARAPHRFALCDTRGRVVGPAHSDPYLRLRRVAEAIFEARRVYEERRDRNQLLDFLHSRIPKTMSRFRLHAFVLLDWLRHFSPAIVTAVPVGLARAEIERLGRESNGMRNDTLGWLLPRIRGDVHILSVDRSFNPRRRLVPLRVKGLSRPMRTRRPQYYRVLDALRQEAHAKWREVLVIGHTLELHGALPLVLGAHFWQFVNGFSARYEVDAVESHERGQVFRSLDDMLTHLRALVRGGLSG